MDSLATPQQVTIGLTGAGGPSYWTQTGNQLYPSTLTNNVGIGTQGATAYALDVSGTLHTNADAYINNNVRVGRGGGNISSNTAVGFGSLFSNTNGQQNTANGFNSLYKNTTGVENTAIGLQALFSNTNGQQNTAIGLSSLYKNTNGQQNTAIGLTSLYSNTTGNLNSAIGFNSLFSNTDGSFNTAIGAYAGADLSGNSSNNTFLGYQANVDSSLYIYNNSTALGYNARIDASNQMVLGGLNTSNLYPGVKIPGSYVGIGGVYNTSSGYALDVSGNANVTGNLTNLMSLGFSSSQSNLSPNFIINAFQFTHSGINVPGDGGNTISGVYYNSTDGTSGTQKHIFTNAPYIFLNIVSTTGVNPQLINASANTIVTSPNNTFSVGVHNTSPSTTPLTAYTVQVLVIGY